MSVDVTRTQDISTALASGAQVVGTVASGDQVNNNGRGLVVMINITNINGGTYTVTIQGKDPVSGGYYTLLVSAALAANALTTLTVYPGVAVTANVSASAPLPRIWRVSVTVATATVTGTIGACVIG